MIDEIQHRFPNPIARVIGAAASHQDPDRVRRLISGVVHYAGLTTIARLLHSGGVPSALQRSTTRVLDKPTIGQWVELIGQADKELLARGRDHSLGISLGHVPERLGESQTLQREIEGGGANKLSVREILALFARFRNDHSHERLPAEQAVRLAPIVVAAVAELVEQLPSFKTEKLLLARQVVREHDGTMRGTFVRMHGEGSPPLHYDPSIAVADRELASGRLFLRGASPDLIPLYPLMVGQDEKIYWLNGGDYHSPLGEPCAGQEKDAAQKALRTLIGSWSAETSPTPPVDVLLPSAPPPDISGYLTARALGERLVERLTPAGANLYRQKLNKSSLDGTISAQMVNDLLKCLNLLDEIDGDRRISPSATKLAIETASASPRGENIRVIRWKPEVLDLLLAEVRTRIGSSAMKAIESNPIPDYDDVGSMTCRRAIDEQLNEYLVEVTGLAKATVTRRLNGAPGGQHVRNTFSDCYDSLEALGHLTANRVLELNLVGALARLAERSERTVTQRLRDAPPRSTVRTLFPPR